MVLGHMIRSKSKTKCAYIHGENKLTFPSLKPIGTELSGLTKACEDIGISLAFSNGTGMI